MSTTDIYELADLVIATLRQKGHSEQADVLQNIIDSGSTGSEILMGLRWHLHKIRASAEPGTGEALLASIVELEEAIARALGS